VGSSYENFSWAAQKPERVEHFRDGTLRRTPFAPLPVDFDPWAFGTFEDLPPELVVAFQAQDWPVVREKLRALMDGVTTDGPYGRQLIQLVRRLPLGIDPLFDRYRAVTAIDYGDWDDLQKCLELRPLESIELEGIRDIWLAPISQTTAPVGPSVHQTALFDIHELQLNRDWRRHKKLMRLMLGTRFSSVTLNRPDMPARRHLLYRALQDAVLLSISEVHGGRLQIALGLARSGQRLGGQGEQLRTVANDLEGLIEYAAGGGVAELSWPSLVASAVGYSPLGTWEMLGHLIPLMSLRADERFAWSVRVLDRVAVGMASPRAELQARSWSIALDVLSGKKRDETGLEALLVEARRAAPGLRVIPLLLDGFTRPRHSSFADALEQARLSGSVWAQVSALTWMTAINPTEWAARSLHRLIKVTAWRRPILVPPQIASEAALGLTARGLRGLSVVEMALVAGRPNVTAEIAMRHAEDDSAPQDAREAGIRALAKLGTSRARELVERAGRRRDDLGVLARRLSSRPASDTALSEREVEVLQLAARGLTNRDIASRLDLSEHTIARHVANARSKLGAANRAEAVSRLAELGRS